MKKPRKKTTLKEEAGRMLLDIGRIVLAGIVIVEILRGQRIDEDMLHGILLVAGSAIVIVCYMFGLFMVKREIKTEKRSKHSLTSTPIHKGRRRKRGKR